ncbi:MAG: arylesterase [Rhodoferax sp.]|uniref:arylesterase n=1 Tax=Rhodoferax sp. TaxID=50421 RepID=UPI001B428D2E|nr:arylesterase [Rhodoferax sp.]MBP9734579.1 arylesterase [Rhodoferax sp.]
MNVTLSPQILSRRHCIAFAASLATAGISTSPKAQSTAARTSPQSTLLVVGDSLSAEYGLARGTGWVALLEKKLAEEKPAIQVVNASISGETSSGGRVRLPALLSQLRPMFLIIELGGNDALRGLPLLMTQENLAAMVNAGRAAGAKVLLLGMQLPPNYGKDYGQRFIDMYAQIAQKHQAHLVPFFLKGLADVPDSLRWFQADRIHPTEAAQATMLANVWPTLKKMLP